MDHRRFERVWSPSIPANGSHHGMNVGLDEHMYHSTQPGQHIPQNQPSLHHQDAQSPTESNYPLQLPTHWPGMALQYSNHPNSHRRNLSSSTQSSMSSNVRSSNGSGFSRHQFRDSFASTNTTWSSISGPSQDEFFLQTDSSLHFRSGSETPYESSSMDNPVSQPRRAASAQRQPPQERQPFATCVSRVKRCGRSTKEPRYWCTSCEQGFGEKYDWKRHEETYQERPEMFQCDLCNSIYFIDKDFLVHHNRGHRCKTCTEKHHVETARRPRVTRTGWGCGFCPRFDSNWNERCNHIAAHFERDGKTMADWKHSQVIFSLLRRPEIHREFQNILESRRRLNPRFGWNQRATGRVEGYPDSNPNPQLQDLLEYFTADQDPLALAHLAYEKGLLQKELPRPPVPPKDFGTEVQASATPCDLTNDTAPWGTFLNTIVEDQVAPTSVCPMLDYDMLNEPYDMTTRPFH